LDALEFNNRIAKIFNADYKVLPGYNTIASAVEWIQKITKGKLLSGDVAKLTPSAVWSATGTITIYSKKAERDLGYKPLYTMEESFARLSDFLDEVLNPNEKEQ
jgi:nucleoside-diphosphate-sugar epimerase